MAIPHGTHPPVEVLQVGLQAPAVHLLAHTVHTRRRIGPKPAIGPAQRRHVDQVRQRVKTGIGFSPRPFRYLQELRRHDPRPQWAGHVSPLKITTARAAFARPGPVVIRFPVFFATMRLSDSLGPSSAAPIPLAAVYHRHGRLFFAAFGHAHKSTVGAGALSAGFSKSRNVGGGRRASRVSGTSCFIRAKGRHPAGCVTASPFSCGGHAAAFGRQDTLGIRDESFRG